MSKALELFSKRLKIFLAEKGWIPADLARALNMKSSQMSKYTNAQTPPGLEIIEKIAVSLGRPISDFFKEEIVISQSVPPKELTGLWAQASDEDREAILNFTKRIVEKSDSKVSKRSKGNDV